LYWHGKKEQVHRFGVSGCRTNCNNAHGLTELYSAAKNASPIENGKKLHALAPFEGEGEAVAVVEV